jgi:nicotinamide phosphoribosyltransferase
MSFATKLCHLEYADGRVREIMKMPKTDTSKISLPGALSVILDETTKLPIVYPKEFRPSVSSTPYMEVVYDHGKVKNWDDFETIRKRLESQWNSYPKHLDVISDKLKTKIELAKQEYKLRRQEMVSQLESG